MPLNPQIDPLLVVDLNSSDDEDGNVVTPSSSRAGTPSSGRAGSPPSLWASHQLTASSPASAGEFRSFWRAGGYDVVSAPAATTAAGQLQHARVHPKFLHSNATSHKWAFGAIAELLDNAVDEICNGATFIKVDRIYNKRDNSPVLLFQDNGGGMDPESVRKCMSLGYSSKKTNTTIGQYGNGFKTSTMRLGADVIVFSRKLSGSQATQSVGLLSYTFLRRTGQDDIIVPMVDFDIVNGRAQPVLHSSQEDWVDTFKIILEWSPFSSTEELMLQFEDIESHGTKIMVFNLWLNDDGVYELDFDDDEEDIRLRDEANLISMSKSPEAKLQSHISYCIRYSLRAYTSVLYLRKFTNFCIILRGKPVAQRNIADELKFSRVLTYKPHSGVASKEANVEITIGFVKEAPTLKVSGFNIYHKNRLIMPFWRALHEGSSRGKGVVGFLEANFIEPAHDKQEFERTSLFLRLETKLRQIVLDYWKSNCYLIGLGLQLQNLGTHDKQKAFPTKTASVGFQAHTQQQLLTEQPIIELASSLQSELRSDQHMIGYAAASDSIESSYIQQPMVRTAEFGEGFSEETAPGAIPSPALVDKIRNENMQLFLRCEEHRQKESELKQTIEKLESELAEARDRCSQLASTVEQRKKTVVSSLTSPQ